MKTSDLSDKASNSDLIDKITNSILIDSSSISDLTEENTTIEPIEPIGNNTEVDEIAFRQVCNFKIEKKIIIFFFFGIVHKPIKKGAYIRIKTHLTKGGEKSEEQEAICKAQKDVTPEDGEQKQADLECTVNATEPGEYDGLEVADDKISGVPTDPNLLNPAKVDELIDIGEVKNYSMPENKEEPIPVFNATSIDTNGSEETGVFYINGEVPDKFELNKNFDFELTLLTGQKVI